MRVGHRKNYFRKGRAIVHLKRYGPMREPVPSNIKLFQPFFLLPLVLRMHSTCTWQSQPRALLLAFILLPHRYLPYHLREFHSRTYMDVLLTLPQQIHNLSLLLILASQLLISQRQKLLMKCFKQSVWTPASSSYVYWHATTVYHTLSSLYMYRADVPLMLFIVYSKH